MTDPAMQPGGTPPPPPPPPAAQKRSNGMATAALVLGIIALLLSWIPAINIVAIILAIIGLILGFVGMSKSKDPMVGGRGMAIWGIVLNALALLLSILVYVGLFAIGNQVANDPALQDAVEDFASELEELATE